MRNLDYSKSEIKNSVFFPVEIAEFADKYRGYDSNSKCMETGKSKLETIHSVNSGRPLTLRAPN